jgi:hypothetical protein
MQKKDNLALAVTGKKEMGRGGIEPPTHGFSVLDSGHKCSA